MSLPENKLELISFQGEIHLIDNESQVANSLKNILNDLDEDKVLGFDTESKPSFQKGEKYGISLLQLATHKSAYLFRLNKIGFPKEIITLLQDKSIVKVGLAIRDDLKGLRAHNEFTPEAFVEIQNLAKKQGLKSMGLQSITEELFQKRLSKRAKLTNWEAEKLTAAQLLYAATDAWIGREIFLKLK